MLYPFYMLVFPLHFQCFFFTSKSVWCPNFRCRCSLSHDQPTVLTTKVTSTGLLWDNTCLCQQEDTWTRLTCALKVKHFYRLPLNALAEGWGEAFSCTRFNFQESLFVRVEWVSECGPRVVSLSTLEDPSWIPWVRYIFSSSHTDASDLFCDMTTELIPQTFYPADLDIWT